MELVMVLTIIALVAAMAAPRFSHATERYRIELAAARLGGDLRFARERAIATGQSLAVIFDTDRGEYTLSGVADPDHRLPEYTVQLGDEPYRVAIRSADFGGNTKLVFNGFGIPAAAGTVRLNGAAGDMVITVEAGSGAVTVARDTGGK